MLGTKDNNRDNDDNADDDHLIFLVSINLNSRTADNKKKIRRHSPHFQNFKDINQPVSSSFADEKRQYIQILVSGNKRNKKKEIVRVTFTGVSSCRPCCAASFSRITNHAGLTRGAPPPRPPSQTGLAASRTYGLHPVLFHTISWPFGTDRHYHYL